jgi:hypothetical protein
MTTTASDLSDLFNNLSFSNHDKLIKEIVFQDTLLILQCYFKELHGLDEVVDFLKVNRLGNDILLRSRFFEIFQGENILYREIVSIIHQQISTVFLIELIPLIDEYIDLVFSVYQS